MLDIVFMSYDEPDAEEHWELLKHRFPYARRVHGVEGIHEAHAAAANLVKTKWFYVVDADAEIHPDFNFEYTPGPPHGYEDCVHVWHSINEVNGLQYGYGGVKLFPTEFVRTARSNAVDFTTSICKNYRPMTEVSCITRFASNEFNAWRSGFREAAKLSAAWWNKGTGVDDELFIRLDAWKTKGAEHKFGQYCMFGANQGASYGYNNRNNSEGMRMLNNFEWLKTEFDKVKL